MVLFRYLFYLWKSARVVVKILPAPEVKPLAYQNPGLCVAGSSTIIPANCLRVPISLSMPIIIVGLTHYKDHSMFFWIHMCPKIPTNINSQYDYREVGSVAGLKEKKDHSGLHSGPTLTLLRPLMYIMLLPPFPEVEL